ncbi:hypothetical protein RPB_4418 [Rhodopseudomonas palustris HaA2]|uniref:DUF1468 domain-containing protein n=1 Tax=Rhodopseudomonas palustris (strain HaA2) TaxID=316058 RepID=Q2IRQ6_RHOP2|nr:tripartite tricarboxylate transporter TctB family protein [Rhodopseudomonas palustris]ABD09104.1 hypothetical protein RPB_4418 [Rhodopseudomonas palustris HaA2]
MSRPIAMARLTTPTYVAVLMLLALALTFGLGAFRLGFWVDDAPGPGVLPLAVSIALLGLLVLVVRERLPADESRFALAPGLAILTTIVYAIVVPYTGFVIATLVLLTIWIRGFYRQSMLRAVIASAGLTGCGLVIFPLLLKVPMQLGPAW